MNEALALGAALATCVAAGDLAARACRAECSRIPAARLGVALLFGPFLVAVALLLWSMLGGPLRAGSCRTLAGLAVAGWLVARRVAARGRATAADCPPAAEPWAAGDLALLAIAALAVASGACFAWITPPTQDAIVNWSLKARLLFDDGTVRSADFALADRHLFHPNYPLGVPLLQAFVFALADAPADRAAKLVLSLPHLGVTLLAFACVRERLGRRRALAAAALLAGLPHFHRVDALLRFGGSVPSGFADPALAAFAAALALLAARVLAARDPDGSGRRGQSGDLRLFFVAAGLAPSIKNEGLPLAVLAIAALLVAARFRRRDAGARSAVRIPARALVSGLLVALALAAPHLWWRASVPAADRDENYAARLSPEVLAAGAWRAPSIAASFALEALAVERHGFTWPVLGAALVVGRRRLLRPGPLAAALLLLAMLLLYGLVYVISPLPLWFHLPTSLSRTLFHLGPLALVLAALLWPAPRDGDGEARARGVRAEAPS